jgi:hypothetical protein
LTERQIKDIERAQATAIKAAPQGAAEAQGATERGAAQAALLVRLKGIGQNGGVPLCREVFYRHFNNRRELAGYFGLPPSRVYSTRVGQEVTIHYRWHALYGRTVRRFYSEKRAGADVVLVEGEPGAAIVVAAWMLDSLICGSMTLGAPCVSLPALSELHQLLVEHGLRRSFPDDDRVVKEASDEERITADPGVTAAARPGARFSANEGHQHGRTDRGDRASRADADGGRRHRERGARR